MNARPAAVNTQLLRAGGLPPPPSQPQGSKYGTSADVVRGARQAALGNGAAPPPRSARRPSSVGTLAGYHPILDAVGGLDELKENMSNTYMRRGRGGPHAAPTKQQAAGPSSYIYHGGPSSASLPGMPKGYTKGNKGKAAPAATPAAGLGAAASRLAAHAASESRARSAGSSLGVVDSQHIRSAGSSSRTLQWHGTGTGYSGTVSFGDRRHGL